MLTLDNLLIMDPPNLTFWLTLGFFLLILVAASLILRKKSEKTRQTVLIAASLCTLVGFILYKILLSMDEDYNQIIQSMGGFNWWGELPFQLCNVNMILIPIAVHTKKRGLLSFCFFGGSLGAFMAMMFAVNGFSGYSLLLPRMIGFYFTHCMIVIEALALASFGLYQPELKDIPRMILTLLLIALAAFGLNLLLRFTGLHPRANYFFTMEPEGVSLLELFYSWIPLPYLYLLPSMVILAVYMSLVMLIFFLVDKGKAALAGRKAP